MAKKKKEEPVVDNETGSLKVKEKPEVQSTGNETKGNITKVVTKMKQPAEDLKTVTKVDLTKKPEETNETKEEVTNDSTDDSRVVDIVEDAGATQEQEEVQPETETQETPVVEEVTNEEKVTEVIEQTIAESIETGKDLPENIQKVIDFMNETGGDLEDYVKLNQDYSKYDDTSVLHEYYRQTKPHLTQDERNFLIEDSFSFDEEVDDVKDVKRKKLAFKEQVANAKNHMDGLKSKYYKEIKSGSKLAPEQQKAIDFFNRYNTDKVEADKAANKQRSVFKEKTNNVFNDKFKGFEYNVGEKKFRFNVKDVNEVKETQSNINNFTKKFMGKNDLIDNADGYHKALFTAMNSDAIANHFYEQGKADAIKESVAKSKNIDMEPRQNHGEVNVGGYKVKAISGDDSNKLRFKIRK